MKITVYLRDDAGEVTLTVECAPASMAYDELEGAAS